MPSFSLMEFLSYFALALLVLFFLYLAVRLMGNAWFRSKSEFLHGIYKKEDTTKRKV